MKNTAQRCSCEVKQMHVFRLHITHNSQLQKYCGEMEQYINWLRQLVSHESGTQLYIDKS